jgi:uncharacterized membrane protein YtjA (UPF0391 family)
MLYWTVLFLIAAPLTGVIDSSGLPAAAGIAKILFAAFVALFALSVMAGRRAFGSPPP